MTSRFIKIAVCLTYLMWPSSVAVPPPPPPNPFPVSDLFDLNHKQTLVAQRVEERLREHGFSDELIVGALVNAYAESGLNIHVVGKEGERGIFQLHPEGLGNRMTIKEMQDVDTSVDRIAKAIRKSKKIMLLEQQRGSAEDHVEAFCIEIERPSNKHKKAQARVRLMEKILIN